MTKFTTALSTLVATVALSACSGGGSSASPSASIVNVTDTVTSTSTVTITHSATVTNSPPSACDDAVRDVEQMITLVGKAEGSVSALTDLLSSMKEAVFVQDLTSTYKLEVLVNKNHDQLNDHLFDIQELISQLKSDQEDCHDAS